MTTPDVPVVSRRDFLNQWDYSPGQHLTMLGPTQRGKTTLGLQLLDRSISYQGIHALILAGKPPKRDTTMNGAAKKLNLRIIQEWPPSPSITDRTRKRRGFVLRPKQTMRNLADDKANLQAEFRKGMMGAYATTDKPWITFVDEAHFVQNDLKLKDEYEAPLMRGAPHNSVWSLIQRGRFMSYLAYDAPDHLFLFFDPDESNQKRYSEIGGIDPKYLRGLSETLKTHRTRTGQTISECIYIRRSGPDVCIVDVA